MAEAASKLQVKQEAINSKRATNNNGIDYYKSSMRMLIETIRVSEQSAASFGMVRSVK